MLIMGVYMQKGEREEVEIGIVSLSSGGVM